MNSLYTREKVVKGAILLVWISLAYNLHSVIAYRSSQMPILNQYSIFYFVMLLGYISILLALMIFGIWIVTEGGRRKFLQLLDLEHIFSANQVYIPFALIITWLIWIALGLQFNVPTGFYRGILSMLSILSIAYGTLYEYDPPEKLKERVASLATKQGLTILDAGIMIAFALIAAITFIGFWRGINSFVFIESDPANISSFVAGISFPELFQKDAVLGNFENFRVYFTIHIPLIRLLGNAAGNFGMAWVYLLAPHIFLQALGFYWLGWTLFKNRYWALLISLTTLSYIDLNLGEIWGVYQVMPRITFQTLLPFLLSLVVIWRNKPSRWPWLMILAGTLIYIHPVSTPAWGLGIWIGLLFCLPSEWDLSKRVKHMFLIGLVFLLTITPFAIHYLSNFSHGEVVNNQEVIQVMEYRFPNGLLDLNKGITVFFTILIEDYLLLVLIGSCGLLVGLLLINNKDALTKLRLVLGWLGGLILLSIVIPFFDHTVANMLGRLPLQVDLVRGLRYLFPVLLIFVIWGFWGLVSDQKLPKNIEWLPLNRLVLIFSLIWGINWLGQHPIPYFGAAVNCWVNGEVYCPATNYEQDKIAVLDAIQEQTPPGSSILPSSIGLEIRYYSLRSVVFNYKDGGILGYGNPQGLLDWYSNELQFQAIIGEEDLAIRTEQFIDMARSLDADYALINWQVIPEVIDNNDATIIYKNKSFALIKLPKDVSLPVPIPQFAENNPDLTSIIYHLSQVGVTYPKN